MTYKDLNDYELLNLSADNEDACDILYKKYEPLIYKIARKMYQANKIKGIELNDFIQEGNIGFTHALRSYNDRKNILFFTYAKVCIEKAIISFVVKNNRQKHKILNESISMEALDEDDKLNSLDKIVMDSSLDPFNIVVNNNNNIYKNLKDKLTDFELMVLELREYGFDYKEIAQLLDKDTKAVDNAIQRIRIKAKKIEENT